MGRDFVPLNAALGVFEISLIEEVVGFGAGEAFIPEQDREIEFLVEPVAIGARFARFLTFVPVHVNREPKDNSLYVELTDDPGKSRQVVRGGLAMEGCEGTDPGLIAGADCQTDAARAEIDAEESAFSKEFGGRGN